MSLQNLRLIHTSDTHLGDDLGHPSSNDALALVISETIILEADFLLFAGDVFDNERISDNCILFFFDQISNLSIPVLLLPGNHDLMHETSIYKREIFKDSPNNLYIFQGKDGEIIDFPDKGIKFWGKAMCEHSPFFEPLSPAPAAEKNSWFIGMAHGHFEEIDTNSGRSSLISPKNIIDSHFDYIALGHWDIYTDISQGAVPAVYSGCPMVVGDSNKPGSISLIDLNPQEGIIHKQWYMNKK